MSRKPIVITAVLAGASLFLSSCGSVDPKEAFTEALNTESTASETSLKVSFEADPETVAKMIRDSLTNNAGESAEVDENTTKIAKMLLSSSYIVETKTRDGSPLKDSRDLSNVDVSFDVEKNDSPLVQLLLKADSAFARADVEKFIDETGIISKDEFNQFKTEAATSWMKDFFSGLWLKFDSEATEDLKGRAEGETFTFDDNSAKELKEKIKTNILNNSTFSNEGDFIVIETDYKKAVNQFAIDYKESNPEDKSLGYSGNLAEKIKDGSKIRTFVKIENNKFTQIKFDVLQYVKGLDRAKVSETGDDRIFDKISEYSLPVVIDIKERTTRLNAPQDYTDVSQEDLTNF